MYLFIAVLFQTKIIRPNEKYEKDTFKISLEHFFFNGMIRFLLLSPICVKKTYPATILRNTSLYI